MINLGSFWELSTLVQQLSQTLQSDANFTVLYTQGLLILDKLRVYSTLCQLTKLNPLVTITFLIDSFDEKFRRTYI
jgi:hypothetical protein